MRSSLSNLEARGYKIRSMPLIEPGRKAPAFALKDQSGKTHRLSEYVGRPLIGKVQKRWDKVKVDGHADEVLAALS